MKTIKLILLAILTCMYQIALTDNGLIKLISWLAFIGLFVGLVFKLEKRYGSD